MYDPWTVAHSVRLPWGKKKEILTIWHVDPESDGTDDSCGWFGPSVTVDDMRWLQKELESPYDRPAYSSTTFEAIVALWPLVRKRVTGEHLRKGLSARDLAEAASLATCPWDNLRSLVRGKVNHEGHWGFEEAYELAVCLLRICMRINRPWWKHPRWHVHHWKIRVAFFENLKRWLTRRCALCGKRFSWGYSPISYWSGKEVWHFDCFEIQRARDAAEKVQSNLTGSLSVTDSPSQESVRELGDGS